jgi:hypothetical protein
MRLLDDDKQFRKLLKAGSAVSQTPNADLQFHYFLELDLLHHQITKSNLRQKIYQQDAEYFSEKINETSR